MELVFIDLRQKIQT